MATLDEVYQAINKVTHPSINYSLLDLGIVKEIDLDDQTVSVVFAFPFPNIPIADQLVGSIANPLIELGLKFQYRIDPMNEEEKAKFMKMEAEAWKG